MAEKIAGKTSPSKLLNYLDGIVEELRAHASGALKAGDIDAVHDARVATRRLKAASDLLAPVLSEDRVEPFDRITRLLRRSLGPLRDLDVMMEHLAAVRSERYRAAANWTIARMQKQRKKSLKKAADDLPAPNVLARLGSWSGLRQEIAAADEAVMTLLTESVHNQLDAFADAAAALASQRPGVDPHELRIAGKSLRYTLEMAKAQGRKLPRKVLAAFKKIQSALGQWHDYVVLTERVLSESADKHLPLHDPALQRGMLRLATSFLQKSQRELQKVTEFWLAGGAVLSEQIRVTFPLTATSVAGNSEPADSDSLVNPLLVSLQAPQNEAVNPPQV